MDDTAKEYASQAFALVQKKYKKELDHLESLGGSEITPSEPHERLANACRIGKAVETDTKKGFPPYTRVAQGVKNWIVQTEVPNQVTRSCEQEVRIAERTPTEFKKVFESIDKQYAEERKELVEKTLKARKEALGPLLTKAHLDKLKNQLTQKTSNAFATERSKAIVMRHDYFVAKHFEAITKHGTQPSARLGPAECDNSQPSPGRETGSTTPSMRLGLVEPQDVEGIPNLVLPLSWYHWDHEQGPMVYDYVAAVCGDDLRTIEEGSLLDKTVRIFFVLQSETNRQRNPLQFLRVQYAICEWVLDVKFESDDALTLDLEIGTVTRFLSSGMSKQGLCRSNDAEIDRIVQSLFGTLSILVNKRREIAQILLMPAVYHELVCRIGHNMVGLVDRIRYEVLNCWCKRLLLGYFSNLFPHFELPPLETDSAFPLSTAFESDTTNLMGAHARDALGIGATAGVGSHKEHGAMFGDEEKVRQGGGF